MAVNVQQGTPGSGKSAVAVARAVAHLRRGGVVAANFHLVDGWAVEAAKRAWLARILRIVAFLWSGPYFAYVHRLADSYYRRFYFVDSLTAIQAIKPKEESVWLLRSIKGKYMEGQGLLLLDECQLIFNSRKFEKNFDWIVFFTQHRKLGWNVILIAHHIDMIDKQIRPLAEYESRFRNLQKVQIPYIGLPLSPFPLFLVVTRYAGLGAGAGTVHSKDMFPLPLWAAQLYDSCLVFSADQWGGETLPQHCGAAPVPLCGVGVVPPPRRISRLVGPHWDHLLQTLPGDEVIELVEIV